MNDFVKAEIRGGAAPASLPTKDCPNSDSLVNARLCKHYTRFAPFPARLSGMNWLIILCA
jgi:hypothetical protein